MKVIHRCLPFQFLITFPFLSNDSKEKSTWNGTLGFHWNQLSMLTGGCSSKRVQRSTLHFQTNSLQFKNYSKHRACPLQAIILETSTILICLYSFVRPFFTCSCLLLVNIVGSSNLPLWLKIGLGFFFITRESRFKID